MTPLPNEFLKKCIPVQEKSRYFDKAEVRGVQKQCQMCGGYFPCTDGRRRFCDACRKARKKLFDANAFQAFKERKKRRILRTAEMCEGLKIENELLREIIKRQNIKLRRAGIEPEEEI